MVAALIIVASALAASVGLGIYLAQRWRKSNERAWKQKDAHHEESLKFTKLEAQYENALGTIEKLEADNALAIAEEEFNAFAVHKIEKVSAPETANALRDAMERWQRVRAEMSKVPGASTTEGDRGDEAVHESDPEAPSDS
jgi:hypothetical protein